MRNISMEWLVVRLIDFLVKHLIGLHMEWKIITKVFDDVKIRYTPSGILHILVQGDYEQIPEYVPSKNDVVVDIGAFVGLYVSKVAKNVGSKGLILAIEPNPINFGYLLETIRLNDLDDVVPIQLALSNFEGFYYLVIGTNNFPSSTSTLERVHGYASPQFNKVLCKVTTLDSLLQLLEINCIDLVKVDVEGAELSVLQGAVKSMKEAIIKKWVIEIHKENSIDEIISYLTSNGYEIKSSRGILFAKLKA